MPLAVAAVGLPAKSPVSSLFPAGALGFTLSHFGLLPAGMSLWASIQAHLASLDFVGTCPKSTAAGWILGEGWLCAWQITEKAHACVHLPLLLQPDFVEEVRYTSHTSKAAAKSGEKGCLEDAFILCVWQGGAAPQQQGNTASAGCTAI